MFGIGLPELLIIALVVLIFIKPKDLPLFFRRVGKVSQQMRDMREGFLSSLREFEDELKSVSTGVDSMAEGRGDASEIDGKLDTERESPGRGKEGLK